MEKTQQLVSEAIVQIENGGGMGNHGNHKITIFDLTHATFYQSDKIEQASEILANWTLGKMQLGEGSEFTMPERPAASTFKSSLLTPRCVCFDSFDTKVYYTTGTTVVLLANELEMQESQNPEICEFVRELQKIAYRQTT